MLLCCAVYVAYLLDSSIRRLSYLSCCRFQFGSNEEMARKQDMRRKQRNIEVYLSKMLDG